MHVQHHVAAVISDYSSRMDGHIIKEGDDVAHVFFGGVALLPRNFAEGDKDCRIDGPAIVQKLPTACCTLFFPFLSRGLLVSGGHILGCFSVVDGARIIGGEGLALEDVGAYGKLLMDISRHGYVYIPFVVIPIEFYSTIIPPCLIYLNLVLFFYCINQVVEMLFTDVLDSKVVDNEGEGNRAVDVLPQPGSVLGIS